MLSMLVGMKDSSVKLLINDLAACQDKKKKYFGKKEHKLKYTQKVVALEWVWYQLFLLSLVDQHYRMIQQDCHKYFFLTDQKFSKNAIAQ